MVSVPSAVKAEIGGVVPGRRIIGTAAAAARTANTEASKNTTRCENRQPMAPATAAMGVCMARVSQPLSMVTRPTVDWLHCCWVTRKTFRCGPSAPRTSASKKFSASREAG
jgi:hypothetical protein